jgi:hypothetical protein
LIRLYSIAFVLTAWLAAPAFAARATEAERYYLGDYAVRIADGDRPTRCRVSIVWANDVGGEFTSTGCEVWPDVAEAARWWFDADAGEARFEDPVHKRRFTVAETDAGFVAILSDDTHLWLENLPKRRKR